MRQTKQDDLSHLNRLYIITRAMTAIPSANKKANPIANMILGDAAGFLPKARTAAYPTRAIIRDGPKVLMNITNAIVKFRITAPLLHQNDQFIISHPRQTSVDANRR